MVSGPVVRVVALAGGTAIYENGIATFGAGLASPHLPHKLVRTERLSEEQEDPVQLGGGAHMEL
jgi:hypothetical protein